MRFVKGIKQNYFLYPIFCFKKGLNKVFDRIQTKLIKEVPQCKQMGSTALISLIYSKSEKSDKCNLKIINLGDTRATLCNEYNIGMSLSLDHKPHLYCEKNRIANMGGVLEYCEVFDNGYEK